LIAQLAGDGEQTGNRSKASSTTTDEADAGNQQRVKQRNIEIQETKRNEKMY
jgi:hypothetical protein